MSRAGGRGAVLLVALAATVLALSGCSVSTTSSNAVEVNDPMAQETPEPELDLQLRPVEGVSRAATAPCPSPPPLTPPAREPATVCSSDGRLTYSLGSAAVTGAQVTSLEALYSAGGPVVQVKLDARGSAALRRITLEGSLREPQSQLAIVSHGRVLAAPVIGEEIDGGVLLITGFDTIEAAQGAVAYIQGPPTTG